MVPNLDNVFFLREKNIAKCYKDTLQGGSIKGDVIFFSNTIYI